MCSFSKEYHEEYVGQESTMFFVELAFHQISASCHPIALVGVRVFKKFGVQNTLLHCQGGSKKLLLQAIDPDVDKHAHINEIVF